MAALVKSIPAATKPAKKLCSGITKRHSARFSTESYTRECHWIPRMFASSEHACDKWHSSREYTALTVVTINCAQTLKGLASSAIGRLEGSRRCASEQSGAAVTPVAATAPPSNWAADEAHRNKGMLCRSPSPSPAARAAKKVQWNQVILCRSS
jgi:hypothetical protein